MLAALAALAAVRGVDASNGGELLTGRRLLQGGGLPPVPDVTAAPVPFDWGVSRIAAPETEAARFQREVDSLLDAPFGSWTQAATVRIHDAPLSGTHSAEFSSSSYRLLARVLVLAPRAARFAFWTPLEILPAA